MAVASGVQSELCSFQRRDDHDDDDGADFILDTSLLFVEGNLKILNYVLVVKRTEAKKCKQCSANILYFTYKIQLVSYQFTTNTLLKNTCPYIIVWYDI